MFMMILFPYRAQRLTVSTLVLVVEHHGVSELGDVIDVYVARRLLREMVLVVVCMQMILPSMSCQCSSFMTWANLFPFSGRFGTG